MGERERRKEGREGEMGGLRGRRIEREKTERGEKGLVEREGTRDIGEIKRARRKWWVGRRGR